MRAWRGEDVVAKYMKEILNYEVEIPPRDYARDPSQVKSKIDYGDFYLLGQTVTLPTLSTYVEFRHKEVVEVKWQKDKTFTNLRWAYKRDIFLCGEVGPSDRLFDKLSRYPFYHVMLSGDQKWAGAVPRVLYEKYRTKFKWTKKKGPEAGRQTESYAVPLDVVEWWPTYMILEDLDEQDNE